MIIPAHNAHLTAIKVPAVPADPGLGITGTPATARWTGIAQAHIDEDVIDVINSGQRTTIYDVVVNLPSNLPVFPNPEDILALEYINSSATENLIVRFTDGGTLFLGKLMVRCRRS